MTCSWCNSVNQINGSQKIRNINEYIESIDSNTQYKSSIDRFYKSIREILSIAKEPKFLDDNPMLGTLLFIGVVSSTENYFREIMSETIQICPVCQAASASQTISLGSVIWHSGCNVEKGSFENISFADADTIKKTCKRYLSYDLNKTGLAFAALDEFDKVCELRHAVVHSSSIMAGKNAIKLGIKSDKNMVKVKINYKQLHECAAICTVLVSSFNTELFSVIVRRWAIEWIKLPLWDSRTDNKKFGEIWGMFFSEIDNQNGSIPYKMTMIRCRNCVKKEFHR